MIATPSVILEQNGRYLLDTIKKGIGAEVVEQAERSLQRLAAESKKKSLQDLHILLSFGGGKDSAWTLAYLRLMQLLLKERVGQTFYLHILLMVHPGVPKGAFENIRAVFEALEIETSKYVRVVTAVQGGSQVELKFGSISEEVVTRFREEILIAGHLSQGNGRETFCNSCNLGLMSVIARYVLAEGGRIDFVVTGDSKGEVLSYWRWVQRTAALFKIGVIDRSKASWGEVFAKLSEINTAYYTGLLGMSSLEDAYYSFPNVKEQNILLPKYFGVFDDTSYEYYTHKHFIENFLCFRLRADTFNFTESDCCNPMLMAYLRGLLADFEGRGYVAGIHEYLGLVTHLMEKKAYSHEMVGRALYEYQSEEGIMRRKEEAEKFALKQFGLSASQLKTMVASPFTDSLVRLERFFKWKHPNKIYLKEAVRAYLECLQWSEKMRITTESPVDSVKQRGDLTLFLEGRGVTFEQFKQAGRFVAEVSGLSPQGLRLLLSRESVSNGNNSRRGGTPELIILRKGDPHQLRISDDPLRANNIITGR